LSATTILRLGCYRLHFGPPHARFVVLPCYTRLRNSVPLYTVAAYTRTHGYVAHCRTAHPFTHTTSYLQVPILFTFSTPVDLLTPHFPDSGSLCITFVLIWFPFTFLLPLVRSVRLHCGFCRFTLQFVVHTTLRFYAFGLDSTHRVCYTLPRRLYLPSRFPFVLAFCGFSRFTARFLPHGRVLPRARIYVCPVLLPRYFRTLLLPLPVHTFPQFCVYVCVTFCCIFAFCLHLRSRICVLFVCPLYLCGWFFGLRSVLHIYAPRIAFAYVRFCAYLGSIRPFPDYHTRSTLPGPCTRCHARYRVVALHYWFTSRFPAVVVTIPRSCVYHVATVMITRTTRFTRTLHAHHYAFAIYVLLLVTRTKATTHGHVLPTTFLPLRSTFILPVHARTLPRFVRHSGYGLRIPFVTCHSLRTLRLHTTTPHHAFAVRGCSTLRVTFAFTLRSHVCYTAVVCLHTHHTVPSVGQFCG